MHCFRMSWGSMAALALVLGLGPAGRADVINGNLNAPSQVDSYGIFISDPAAFSATASTPGTNSQLDTLMFLFNSAGQGVEANDDTVNGSGPYDPRSTLPAGNPFSPTTPGFYTLVLSTYRFAPFDANNNQIFGTLFNEGVFGPTSNLPLASFQATADTGYSGEVNTGPYEIIITGATVVPEPAALTLAALGLVGVAAWRRRRTVA